MDNVFVARFNGNISYVVCCGGDTIGTIASDLVILWRVIKENISYVVVLLVLLVRIGDVAVKENISYVV